MLIKIKKNSQFFTIDKRHNNVILRDLNNDSIEKLYYVIQDRLIVILDDYDSVLQGSFDVVCIEFYELEVSEEFKIISPYKKLDEKHKFKLDSRNWSRWKFR